MLQSLCNFSKYIRIQKIITYCGCYDCNSLQRLVTSCRNTDHLSHFGCITKTCLPVLPTKMFKSYFLSIAQWVLLRSETPSIPLESVSISAPIRNITLTMMWSLNIKCLFTNVGNWTGLIKLKTFCFDLHFINFFNSVHLQY